MKKVLVGISGGVDSAVAAYLLLKQGYEVVGITFRFTEDFDSTEAEKVCDKLNIEHHVVDYRKEFKEQIIDKFISDYEKGITPNPCVMCNKNVKINFLYQNMIKLGCDFIATGHYAKSKDGLIYKSQDLNKDQTYFLCEVDKEILSKIIFPLEGIKKDKVREIASEINLDNANKKDSFDVCFINSNFKEYIKNHIKPSYGDVIDVKTNKKVGEHNGLFNYTIGQRRGLNIGGMKDRLFVVGKDVDKNILYVALGEDTSYLISDSCIIENLNIINDYDFDNVTAKFRYRSKEEIVKVELIDNNKAIIRYDNIKSVTPGQICALYNKDVLIGGGIIKEVMKNNQKLWYLS